MSGLSSCFFVCLFFNIVLEVRASAKRHTDWKGETKTLFADDMIMYLKILTNLKKNLLDY